MNRRISRRDFLRVAAGSAAITGLSPAARRVLLEPFARSPEETLPGEEAWYASTCRQCAAGCGIIVRVSNGRARKIEGNPLHPLNHGKLCARGQAGLQVLYNPDRLKNAVRQTGGRGSRQFDALPWSEALDLLAEKLTALGNPQRLLFFGGLMQDHLYRLVSRWLESFGAPPPVVFDLHSALEGRTAAERLSQAFFGARELPVYDLARADVAFSFGANLLETWMSPVAQSFAYGEMRQGGSGGRGLLVQFEPRLSSTAASADEWVPVPPGSEGFVALGIGRIIVEEKLGHVGSHREHAGLYQDIDVREMAAASQVPVETLRRLAVLFADADHAVAIPGGYLAGQTNGFASMQAVQALNLLAAQLGRVGGVFLSHPGPTAAARESPSVDSFDSVQEAIARMRDGGVDLALVYGANPVFELPAAAGFTEALAEVPYVVSFSSFVDETAVRSDLILPDHVYLEGWGYQVPSPGSDRPLVSSQQPVVNPVYDTRSTADVILTMAARQGGAVTEAIPWADEVSLMEEVASELQSSSLSAFEARSAASFWAQWRQYGGWWSQQAIPREPEPTEIINAPLPRRAAEFDGDESLYPLHLYPYASIALSDGRGAHLPWLQETPDPMTTARWETWVELSPSTAAELGVDQDDIVRVVSPHGSLEAAAVVFPGLRSDVVAVPVGQGHTDFGRFAERRGSNPISLLGLMTDPDTGSLAWGATRVRVEATGRKRPLARLESLDGDGRETVD
ncbi:MAG TPA: molybdopterin-dependent oxidoreductase [Anaerolineales bacterium]|nr:molybdopterin-dependent oxidoreductase [Anaerolineales bacterium]